MGFWDLINSTTEAVKRNAPAPAAVIDACKASYGYSSAVVGNIDNAVRVNGMQALNDYMPSKEPGQGSAFSLPSSPKMLLVMLSGN